MLTRKSFIVLSVLVIILVTGCSDSTIRINSNEKTRWWAGVVNHGHLMPLKGNYHADLNANAYGNQAQPLLLSSSGDVVWCENAPRISFRNGKLKVHAEGKISHYKAGNCLKDAYLFASDSLFPPSGLMPDSRLFSSPQYNTWIELLNNQNQEDILKYAAGIIKNGFPPGVFMIDNHWQEDHGRWDFHPGRFKDPGAMIDSLHDMGFTVMLWIAPFVSPDTDELFHKLESEGLLLKKDSNTAMVRWWDGVSALLDFSNPRTVEWFEGQLAFLVEKYGIGGFKFDAGDPEYYEGLESHTGISPNKHCELFGQFGLLYPLNEYRAMWKMGGQPLAERLRDKTHTWEDLQKLIPQMILEGLSGYPFSCPDMIGGGESSSFYGTNAADLDQELIVRSAQVHALMPMMQFSAAPWRILDEDNFEAVRKAVRIREQYTDYILELARTAAETNEPIVRSLEYAYPNMGYADVKDQFLLGEKLLIAPVVQKGKPERHVKLPPGIWTDQKGNEHLGPSEINVEAKINKLPIFEKKMLNTQR